MISNQLKMTLTKIPQLILPVLLLACIFVSCQTTDTKTNNTDADSLTSHIADSLMSDSETRDELLYRSIIDSVYQQVPKNVLTALLAGNDRFAQKTTVVFQSDEAIPDSINRRKPFLILTDIDLPKSVEKIFDLKEEMFLKLSSPACITNPKQMAVMEYAVDYSGTKVIIVLANSNSRIIGAACDNVHSGMFGYITAELQKAMNTAQEFADRSSINKDFVNHVSQNQAGLSLQQILNQSPQIKKQIQEGKVIVKSAYYNDQDGTVSILEEKNPLNSLTKK